MSADTVTTSAPLVVWGGQAHGSATTLGGKGAGLTRMAAANLPVPPFFVVTTAAWAEWKTRGGLSPELETMISQALHWLEEETGRTFGGAPEPLLVSVRSSGPVSMPGMMDTVLNLGLTPQSVGALLEGSGDLRFVADTIQTYLAGTPELRREGSGPARFRHPRAHAQLTDAIDQIFASWNNERAVLYRKLRAIPDELGTAVVVQAMVFGNLDPASGTGVLFTRDALSGAAVPSGEWVAGAQGEAIVAGRVTPNGLEELRRAHPDAYEELIAHGQRLEQEDRHPQDIEFTVEGGRLFILQTRPLRLSPLASCRVAVELVEAGLLTVEEAALRLIDVDLDHIVVERVDATAAPVAVGLPAAPGVATGVVVRDVREAVRQAERKEAVVLLRPETNPNDLAGMRVAAAIVTERGGTTSHAAIVARDLAVPCVVGCGPLAEVVDGTVVTVDGSEGRLYEGRPESHRELPPFVAAALAIREAAGAEPGAAKTIGIGPRRDLRDVLLWLVLKSLVVTSELDERLERGGAADDKQALFDAGWLAEDAGFVYLTEAGNEGLSELCRAVLEPGTGDDLDAFFTSFEPIDRRLKVVATAWQDVRAIDDPERMMQVLESWFEVDDDLTALVENHPATAAVLDHQLVALREARRRFQAGDMESFTGVADTSYHSVWYVTHELILRTLGRARQE